MTEDEYQIEIARQRHFARAWLAVQLDEMCREYGWNPVQVWRVPRIHEQRAQEYGAFRPGFITGINAV